ncbi:MAG: EAL domain-containing protein [Hydrogenovibrio sp.]|uniref:EAL domain-containing protein n=1 Tax=Hydrogenovibrio sp. TaxID=2065821 RepID=UPI00287016CD|nr:EAL domain-containing protein [Hydrogenovibrio sp.]MDR9498191.1 EAL domain-containing protein [Hydrogenovibrio sp.]
MTIPIETAKAGCQQCQRPLGFDFTFAFQPIVDVAARTVFGYEALVRDPVEKNAWAVLKKVDDSNRYAFDQACRQTAIALAAALNMDKILSINFLPNAVYEPEHCIQSTIRAARKHDFPIEQIMFEITESERVVDQQHLTNIFQYYQKQGFITALDDFGAGHAGLNMLANFQPGLLKIDMELVQDVSRDPVKAIIARHLVAMCQEMNVTVLAEGVETLEDVRFYQNLGVTLMQGYFFARPGIETLPEPDFSQL